jgi:hypothetical protein
MQHIHYMVCSIHSRLGSIDIQETERVQRYRQQLFQYPGSYSGPCSQASRL